MASTRLARKLAEARAAYEGLPPELRVRFEAGLLAARDALTSADEIPKHARHAILEAVAMAFTEGYVGGAWRKVHQALAEEAPQLYEAVKDLLPNAQSGDHPLAL